MKLFGDDLVAFIVVINICNLLSELDMPKYGAQNQWLFP